MADTYLVTGGMGCIGAWALRHLQRSGKRAVNFDQSTDRHRINWLLSADDQRDITFVQGDLRDTNAVKAVFAELRHLFQNAADYIAQGLGVAYADLGSDQDLAQVLQKSRPEAEVDFEDLYQRRFGKIVSMFGYD